MLILVENANLWHGSLTRHHQHHAPTSKHKISQCSALWVKFTADNILKIINIFSYFSPKQVLTFHAKFACNLKSCSWGKIRKYHLFVICWITPEKVKVKYEYWQATFDALSEKRAFISNVGNKGTGQPVHLQADLGLYYSHKGTDYTW